jgi:hypothetical protein
MRLVNNVFRKSMVSYTVKFTLNKIKTTLAQINLKIKTTMVVEMTN